jgi:hypothetical protein
MLLTAVLLLQIASMQSLPPDVGVEPQPTDHRTPRKVLLHSCERVFYLAHPATWDTIEVYCPNGCRTYWMDLYDDVRGQCATHREELPPSSTPYVYTNPHRSIILIVEGASELRSSSPICWFAINAERAITSGSVCAF